MNHIPYFKNQVVRDLAWSCFGPNLIDTFLETDSSHEIPALKLNLTAERIQWLMEIEMIP